MKTVEAFVVAGDSGCGALRRHGRRRGRRRGGTRDGGSERAGENELEEAVNHRSSLQGHIGIAVFPARMNSKASSASGARSGSALTPSTARRKRALRSGGGVSFVSFAF